MIATSAKKLCGKRPLVRAPYNNGVAENRKTRDAIDATRKSYSVES